MAELIHLPPASEIEELRPLSVQHRGVPYCVVKVGGEVRAYVAVCSHKDLAMFPPQLKAGRLVCPHHKVAFDPATGEVADDRGKEVPSGLPSVKLEVIDGALYLKAKKKHRRLLPKSERRRVRQRT